MKNPIKIPTQFIKPIQTFLKGELKKLEKRKKELQEEDPFSSPDRLVDNAASDADAAEQVGHARSEALRNQIDKRLIQIRKALTRIKLGKYGSCEKCGQMIDTDRLSIYPSATMCVKCERKKEKTTS
jgi:DnaK suppressor protein